MTALIGLCIFTAGGALGLLIGVLLGALWRIEMMDDLDDAEAEVERLRGRVG
jgi:hypothetical protein